MTTLKLYQEVMEDVITGVREFFIESGVEEHVLQDLKQLWETKLHASKAVSNQKPEGVFRKVGESNGTGVFQKQPQQVAKQVVGQVAPNNHVQTPGGANAVVENKMVPIQITLPAQPGSDLGQRVLSIQVPASALQGNQLHKILTGPVISATMGLPQPIANNLLQQHVNAALSGASQSINLGQAVVNKPVVQGDSIVIVDSDDDVEIVQPTKESGPSSTSKCCCKCKCKSKRKYPVQDMVILPGMVVHQHDGGNDTSDEDDDGSDDEEDSEDAEDDRDEDEQEMEDTGPEEEPLNSEDDVTDEDPADLFDTDNVVVCQYDKISRTRNKWKFHLKDGIMNMNGEDYLFQKANGDAEW